MELAFEEAPETSVVESTNVRKVQTENAPFSNVRLSQAARARAFFYAYVTRYATGGTGRFCRERKSYPRVTRALRKERKERRQRNRIDGYMRYVHWCATRNTTARKFRTSTTFDLSIIASIRERGAGRISIFSSFILNASPFLLSIGVHANLYRARRETKQLSLSLSPSLSSRDTIASFKQRE